MVKILFVLAFIPLSSFAARGSSPLNPGRFQVVQISDFRKDQYLIDTQTGKLWSKVCAAGTSEDCKFSYWSTEVVEEINASSKAINEAIKKARGD